MKRHAFTWFWIAVLLLAGCQPAPQALTSTRLQMGTLFTITLWGSSDAPAQAAFAEIDRLEQLLSAHRPQTVVAKLNAGPRGEWVTIPDELGRVLVKAFTFRAASEGAFDVGMWRLSELWELSSEPLPSAPPPADKVAAWKAAYRPDDVALRKVDGMYQLRLGSAAVALDLGGIGKGYAVDRAIEVLRQAGVENAIVNAGGNLRVIGSKGGQPWKIGVQHPRRPQEAIAALALQGDVSLSTSGDYERYFIHEGERYHHIMDPATGYPARAGVVEATVQAVDAASADALSTAVFVLGAERGLQLLAGIPQTEGLLVLSDGATRQSPGFRGELLTGR